MSAVHFINHFCSAVFSYFGSIALWFLLFVVLCYTGELFHRFVQMATVKLGTLGMYLLLLFMAAFMASIDNYRLLHIFFSLFTAQGNP